MKLSSIYKVIDGDTFEIIARKQYGLESEANRIAKVNPGSSEPLVVGTTLTIPVIPDTPIDTQSYVISNNDNEVAILIDGIRFRFWDRVRITLNLDGMSMMAFSAPFDSSSSDTRKIFKPFSYKNVVVTVGGEPLFTGTMVIINPIVQTNQKIIEVNGYSLPGVLADCTPPASVYSGETNNLEFNDQGLIEIATTLIEPFGIGVEFQADQGAIFERVALKPDEKILTFLIRLAKQRKLIISSTPRGKLLFLKPSGMTNPVAILKQGVSPVLGVTPLFNPQDYYSHITGIEPALVGLAGSQYTVKNPHLNGVVRPFTFTTPDTISADVKATVDAKIGRMFGDIVGYSVPVATWRDPSGKLWSTGDIVILIAPDAMVYTEYKFIIRSVEFDRESTSEIAILNLTFPESFNGTIPKVLPWDE